MSSLKKQSGFTLLELIVSLSILAIISGIVMGGMRLGISSRDAGEKKANLYQRLRFIGEQISSKIKSTHPLFILPPELKLSENPSIPENLEKIDKVLVFEGLSNSIRLITFSNALSMLRNPPWAHDVFIYLGQHPIDDEEGIIMAERNVSLREVNSEFDPKDPQTEFITLAEDVAFLEFFYYKMEKLPGEDTTDRGEATYEYKGDWQETFIVKPIDDEIETLFFEDQDQEAFFKKNHISMPRAIQISIGLIEKSFNSPDEEAKIVYLPPTIYPLNVGVEFNRPPLEEETNEKSS